MRLNDCATTGYLSAIPKDKIIKPETVLAKMPVDRKIKSGIGTFAIFKIKAIAELHNNGIFKTAIKESFAENFSVLARLYAAASAEPTITDNGVMVISNNTATFNTSF